MKVPDDLNHDEARGYHLGFEAFQKKVPEDLIRTLVSGMVQTTIKNIDKYTPSMVVSRLIDTCALNRLLRKPYPLDSLEEIISGDSAKQALLAELMNKLFPIEKE